MFQCLLSPGITAEEFIAQTPSIGSRYEQMRDLLSDIIPCRWENVNLFSVLNVPDLDNTTDVWFTVSGPPYYQAEKLNGIVASHIDKV